MVYLRQAAEMTLFNRKVTAEEMLARGLISRVIPHDKFEEMTRAMIIEYSQLSTKVGAKLLNMRLRKRAVAICL